MSFDPTAVPLDLLRARAHNLRWAEQPPGVIPLTAADPDFAVAPAIRAAVQEYMAGGVCSYGPGVGLAEFRGAVADYFVGRRGVPVQADGVLATDSAARAMDLVARFVLQPGDEALVFDPVDFLFGHVVQANGGTVVRVPISTADGSLNLAAIDRAITPRTRLLCLCNPHNPLGRVFRPDELQALADRVQAHKLWVMSDEIWSDIVYAPHQFSSIAHPQYGVSDRTILVHGFSKNFGLAGLRIGAIACADADVVRRLADLSRAPFTIAGAATLSQIAAIAALDSAWEWQGQFLAHLHQMRDLAVSRLNALPGVHCTPPEGTYVAFADIRGTGLDSQGFVDKALDEAQVALVPGLPRWFGPGAQGHIRLCFSTSQAILEEAFGRLEGVFGVG